MLSIADVTSCTALLKIILDKMLAGSPTLYSVTMKLLLSTGANRGKQGIALALGDLELHQRWEGILMVVGTEHRIMTWLYWYC